MKYFFRFVSSVPSPNRRLLIKRFNPSRNNWLAFILFHGPKEGVGRSAQPFRVVLNELKPNVTMTPKLVFGKLPADRVQRVIGTHFCMTKKAEWNAVAYRIRTTFGFGNDMMQLHPCSRKRPTDAAPATTSDECFCGYVRRKWHALRLRADVVMNVSPNAAHNCEQSLKAVWYTLIPLTGDA
jgi:hypothetical protein